MSISCTFAFLSIAILTSTNANAQAIPAISPNRVSVVLEIAPVAKKNSESESLWHRPFTYRDNKIPPPLLVVNDKIVPYALLSGLNPQQIENIIILKGEEAIKQFGASGINGIIVITMKKRRWFHPKKSPLN